MIPIERTKPNTGAIVKVEPSTFTLFLWYFETFLAPDPLNSLVVYDPAIPLQQRGDPTISIPTVLTGQGADICAKCRLIIRYNRKTSLRRSWLSYDEANASFGIWQQLFDHFGGPAPFVRAQKFPRAASLRISLSIERFATSFRN